MNILHVITGLGMGGAEKVVFDLCKISVADTENNMKVVSLDDSEERLEDFEKLGIEVLQLKMEKTLGSLISSLYRLKKIISSNSIDVVHAHMAHSAIIMSIYNVLNKNIPLVFTPHSTDIEGLSRELILKLLRGYRKMDILFSEEHHQHYNKKSKWKVIENGIEIDEINSRSRQLKPDTFTFIHVARFNVAKNHEFLIDCVESLKKRGFSFKLNLVGDGELKGRIELLVRQRDLDDIVTFLGLRKDIPELLGKAHVFVLPSKWEGLPISVLEAAAAKVPIITTNVGSLGELLGDQRGITCEEQFFLDKMEFSMENYDLMKIYSEKLYDHIEEKYALKSIYKIHVELYDEIIQN